MTNCNNEKEFKVIFIKKVKSKRLSNWIKTFF